MKRAFTLILAIACLPAFAQKLAKLTVEKIMRDPKWIGVSPSNVRWSNDSKKIYFNWNPDSTLRDGLFEINPINLNPQKVSIDEQKTMIPENGNWNKARTLKVYEKNGDIFILNIKTGLSQQLTSTVDAESSPTFGLNDTKILFTKGDNLFSINLSGSEIVQLTNFTRQAGAAQPTVTGRRGSGRNLAASTQGNGSEQDAWLKAQQMELFDVFKKREQLRLIDSARQKQLEVKKLREIAIDAKTVDQVVLSPDGRYVCYRLSIQPTGHVGNVPNYVTRSGYTEDIPNRTKVGAPQPEYQSYVFDTLRDTVYQVITADIPGIKDLPDYLKDYPQQLEERKNNNEDRNVSIAGPFWSEDGKNAVVVASAEDYKDRWIMKLDAQTGKLSLIDRQHDDAWIAGPGIGASYWEGNIGWTDDTHFYYQSEASGYSHIYLADVTTGTKKQLTSGKWEVQTLQLSNDKKDFYFTANMEHPGVTDFYRMPVNGGTPLKLTSMKGGNDVSLSPDEKWLTILYSYNNKPAELYLQANRPGAKAVQVTNSVSDEFKSYPWRDAPIITFKNRYGVDVYARVYTPKYADPAKPAVIFVHGAGYLQNVTYSWSYYFREMMFNNMLADNGYTVLDIDYTGSAGYGRDCRTGIYRHMGGKDLTDQVDGVKMLVEKYGVNPAHVGLYGGSYGGFMTLMALFTKPDVFAAGAAIRSVTDWAHYNHEYTANILNEPFNDEKAYWQSSPIYFADGLKGRLLMCHGMVDQNVNFQDIVRLTQRLIELHKPNWELAVFPVEDHGFVEPSSWTDEYSRIFKLFEEALKK